MSQSDALAAAQLLKSHLEAHGVTVSIELQEDVRGLWDVLGKRGVISHHTASHDYQGLTPLLALVKRGRLSEGINGPLANGYGGRDLVYRILCMGKANHAGPGGPLTLGQAIPQDFGNLFTWGTEYEGGYEEWTPEMREFMAKANAGLLDYFGYGVEGHAEHKTWAPTRKIDRLNYTAESGRQEIITLGGAAGVVTPVNNTPAPVGASPWASANPDTIFTNGSRVLRLYSAGSDVRFIQGIIGVNPDGYYGGVSVAAAKVWQGKNGLVKDGIIGDRSWAAALTQSSPVIHTAPDGNDFLKEDGIPGSRTISRAQQVMGTPIDGVVSKPKSSMWVAIQVFLNSVVPAASIFDLTGKDALDTDGDPGKKTIAVLQYWLYNQQSAEFLNRAPRASDFDGIDGPETWKLFQHALNKAFAGSKRF